MTRDWEPDSVAAVRKALESRAERGDSVPGPQQLRRWCAAHPRDGDAVVDLIELDAPPEIEVWRRMSQIGSQKVVYDARWRRARPIVLKRFRGPVTEQQHHLLERELQPHPLAMAHPNIIETHVFKNHKDESFLVEKKLSVVLSDSWQTEGVAEAANLLYDIALALHYLHARDLVHGDIKPDNLGFDEGRYVLLDFGICRKVNLFDGGSTATGSLRTRAPELLLGAGNHGFSSDVFALGAVVFNGMVGAFPFFHPDEHVPRVSAPEERAKVEETLHQRVTEEYEQFVESRLRESVRHEGLQKILRAMLAFEPDDRPETGDLVALARTYLVAFIRTVSEDAALQVDEQLDQLDAYLPAGDLTTTLPRRRLMDLQVLLDGYGSTELGAERAKTLSALRQRAGLADPA